jgi:transposase InsO family protein
MAKIMKVGRSGYHRYLKRIPGAQEQKNVELIKKIKMIHQAKRKVYGSPRIHAELKKQGENCSRKRVAKLMRLHGIRAKMKCGFQRRKRYTTVKSPNLLNQKFEVSKPNEIWLADITYIRTLDGWLYVAAILDLFSRRIVGLSMSSRMKADLVKNALQQAVINRKPRNSLIHHSDRGAQYTSEDFRQAAKSYKMQLSMNSGSCYDNAPMESFFHTLKTEHTYLMGAKTRKETKNDIFEFIEVFYNRQRSHSKLGYLSPYEFEKMYFEKQRLCS